MQFLKLAAKPKPRSKRSSPATRCRLVWRLARPTKQNVAAITNIPKVYLHRVGNYLRRTGFLIIGDHTFKQECPMLRKIAIGLATIAAIGIASVPMNASARGGGGGGHGGGGGSHGGGSGFHGGGAAFHGGMATGGGFAGSRIAAMPGRTGFSGMSGRGFHNRHHFRNFAFFGIGGSYAYADYPYDDCYDLMRVRTHHGWRWRRVCG
jgi:hypothetical protein